MIILATGGEPARAVANSQPLHYSADKQIWDRKINRVELFGHAIASQPGESLSADYIALDLNNRILDARGNCVYIAQGTVIRGKEMHFNLDTRTGSIVAGRVSTDQFTLAGERINKLGDGRFQTHWGEYSACRDCPQSWTFQAEDVDMEIEGYSYMNNVTTKVKDAPALWLPYLIIPMKTRRQTGFLFPGFSLSGDNGGVFMLPFFWAINRSADMTVAVGEYTARGARTELEGRYALTPRSGGRANVFYQNDKTFAPKHNRWAVDIAQTQELALGFEEKLRLTEVSDNEYPIKIGDVPGRGEPVVASDLAFSYASPDVSAYIGARRFRNLLNTEGNPDVNPSDADRRAVDFDPTTVQVFPSATLTTRDQFLFGGPVATGISLGITNFTRSAGLFDPDAIGTADRTDCPGATPDGFCPGIDPLRKATRVSVSPSLYTAFRPWDVVSVVPSLRYNGFFYDFGGQGVGPLQRGYLLFQTDLSAQLEKIYEYPDDSSVPRVKHLIRPLLTYSYIPEFSVREPTDHPFIHQINYAQANNVQGYNFDDYDIVPKDQTSSNANYFVPLGNSLAYGFTTQLIRRRGAVTSDTPTYQTTVEFSAGQALNFRELYREDLPPGTERQPWTRFFSVAQFNFDKVHSSTTYYYYPYAGARNVISTAFSYIFEQGVRQRVLYFDRSLNLGYSYNRLQGNTSNLTGTLNFSLNDYVLPSLSTSYDFIEHKFFAVGVGIQFQSPSQCWRLTTNISRTTDRGLVPAFDFSLNLTGSGFGDVTALANQAGAIR